MTRNWLWLTVILVSTNWAWARPKDDIHPVYRPEKDDTLDDRMDVTTTERDSYLPSITQDTPAEEMAPKEKKGIEHYANVARASSDDVSLNPTVAKVTGQLIDTIGQMVDQDTRTPPKLKEIVKEKSDKNETDVVSVTESKLDGEKVQANGKFELRMNEPALSADASEGKASSSKKDEIVKGVAVPVIMDEDMATPPKKLQKIPNIAKPPKEEKKKVSTAKPAKETPTTTPSSGLSTWILLSDNREATTPSTPKNKNATKKPAKNQATTVKPTTVKLVMKKTATKPEAKNPEPVSALEAMVKNQKKTPGPFRANQKKKADDTAEKKVVTVPPAFSIDTTEMSMTESSPTDSTVETATKKKKTSSKKKKKNKNRRKKPAEKSGADQDVKDLVKQPKQPVGAQFYNFLSREIMPTVGLGLVGVLVTAGLAGLLGYNPFVGANLPVRRTYESQHGYSPNGNYYAYNSEYGDTDGGQNEEVLFREVLSGMPEDSRYKVPQSEVSYPESQLYHSQEQAYDAAKTPAQPSNVAADTGYGTVYGTSYDAYTNKESVGKYPVYSSSGHGSYYPEQQVSSTTEKFKASAKYNTESTIEKQPEALYRVSSDYSSEDRLNSGGEETSWHRVGSPLDYSQEDHSRHSSQVDYSPMEPGPRRLNLEKMTQQLTSVPKRSKRSPEGPLTRLIRRSNAVSDSQNEIDNEIDVGDDLRAKPEDSTVLPEAEAEITTVDPMTESVSTEKVMSASEDSKEPSLIDSFPTEASTPSGENPPSLMDVFRRLAQFKLRLGLSFLKASTEAFSRYLDGVQRKVEDSMANDTTLPSIKVWMGRDSNVNDESTMRVREKRFQRDLGSSETNNNKRK